MNHPAPAESSGLAEESKTAEIALLEAVRSILLKQDRETLRLLEARLQQSDRQNQISQEDLRVEIQRVDGNLQGLQGQVSHLERKAQEDAEGLVERLTPVMTNLIRRTIHDSREEMAEVIGPVMGEAIRVQIRDSRDDMVEALSPVIGETVQKAVSGFVREIQRNIDARLRSAIGPKSFLRQLSARMSGVSEGELALRDALPFSIHKVFLIQHGSGLLLAQNLQGEASVEDSDLIGAMLTAIRDFGHDAFSSMGGAGDELDEISYGEQRIVIQSSRYAYLAVVFTGIEPEGFRTNLRRFMTELHLRYGNALRDFRGDPDTLPNFQPIMEKLEVQLAGEEPITEMPRVQRRFLAGAGIFLVIFLALSCFYLRFTIALLPIAFPSPTFRPTATNTCTPTFTLTFTPTSTSTPTASYTPTATQSPTITPSPTQTPTLTVTRTPTLTLTPTITPTPVEAFVSGNVWVHRIPSRAISPFTVLHAGQHVKILGVFADWYNIQWYSEQGVLAGWVYSPYVTVNVELPSSIITPSTTPRP